MAPSPTESSVRRTPCEPNTAFRRLRGDLSPGEFAAAVRRAAHEIGERVSCDARYVGRVEAGEIRCPNYAYERVFKHMFPGRSLEELGFAPREAVRGRRSGASGQALEPVGAANSENGESQSESEESDVLRRAFMTSGPATALAAALPLPFGGGAAGRGRRLGECDARAVEEAVRHIRVLDDQHGGDVLYRRAGLALRQTYVLLDEGGYVQSVAHRLQCGAGELAISVGWLAHDSGHHDDARSYYAEALATARMSGDAALEAHAFSNTAFLARDAGRPREAVRAAQAAQRAAATLGSARLRSLLALREAGGWAGLGDRRACERALLRAQRLFAEGACAADPEWMSFYGEAELEGLEAQCWSRLGDYRRAVEHARRGVALQDPHFTRNTALYSAELAGDLAVVGDPAEAAEAGSRALGLMAVPGAAGGRVSSSRIQGMLDAAARALRPHAGLPTVAEFLGRQRQASR